MFRNYLAAAFGNLARNWLYTGVTVLGLAAGFAAAMLIGLYVRDEYSFERFISGYQQVYRLEMDVLAPGQKPQRTDSSLMTAGPNLALDFPEVEHVARLSRSSQWVGRGEAKTHERVAWVDPSFFEVLSYPVLAGDPVAALNDPDGLVLTRETARKYFGEDAPIGKTLAVQSVNGGPPPYDVAHPMRVEAVLKDVPSETHLEPFGIFASGRAAWSGLTFETFYEGRSGRPDVSVWTYAKLRPGASPDRIRAGLPAFVARHYAGPIGWRIRFEPLQDLHFSGDARTVDAGIAAVGALIVLIAAINFVTLMTARATRRAVEVGVRKAVGARRRDLIVQFMGEALIYVLAAMLISMAVVELALPSVNAFLKRTIAFDYLSDPWLAAAIVGAALLTGLVAGLYPAVVLSSFRPASALKGGGGPPAGSPGVRQGLVVIQFAILTVLIIVTATIWRQTSFALQTLQRLNVDQIVYMGGCNPAFKQELAKVPGVSAVACVSDQAIGLFPLKSLARDPARGNLSIDTAPTDAGFFEMHGLKPLAGRFFSKDRGEDMLLYRLGAGPESQPTVVLNESGVRRLGFSSPQEAVGRSISWGRWSAASPDGGSSPPLRSSRIIGVVRDFTLNSIRTPIDPTIYFVDSVGARTVFARLDGRRLPETLQAIDELWRKTGHTRPNDRGFLGQSMRETYRDVMLQGTMIATSTCLAVVIALLGLFALAAFTTERRTKEIGVRKAMGAGTFDVVRLLLWQFTRPVLWANLIAWPIAFWAADHWLHGFAYRVDLPPWLFLGAAAAAVTIAWATVSTHAWMVAQARPVTALRYE